MNPLHEVMMQSETMKEIMPTNFMDTALKYLPLIVAVAMMVFGYGTLNSNLNNLQSRVAANESAVLTANASYAQVAPQISAINAKLDIIIKHDGL